MVSLRLVLIASFLLMGLATCSGCSPFYVIRSGWEEVKILYKRQEIEALVQDEQIDTSLKAKLRLVMEARAFASELGLEPGGSYSQYSDVGREVLLWVLTGAKKTALEPVTWWFPIVGRIPYKGFFDKESALEEAKDLKDEGYDVYLRTSPAFSTLGWFDDPLLSTLIAFDEVSLVDTVIHEIVHNTIWIKGHADFNETLANFIGAMGAKEFFLKKFGENSEQTQQALDRWHDELLFADFISKLKGDLEKLYNSLGDAKARAMLSESPTFELAEEVITEADILSRRKAIFAQAIVSWQDSSYKLRSERYKNAVGNLNNAVILALETYLKNTHLFDELYTKHGRSIKQSISFLKENEDRLSSSENPFDVLKSTIEENGG